MTETTKEVQIDREPFDEQLRYGDECPVCGESVKAVVTGVSTEGPRVYNSECSQYAEEVGSRYIFHQ